MKQQRAFMSETGLSTASLQTLKRRVPEFRLTPRAQKDLTMIARYTMKTRAREQVKTYLSALTRRLEWLAGNPGLGRSRDDIAKGYRRYRDGNHLIVYVVKKDHIAVIGVPHTSVDIETHLQ